MLPIGSVIHKALTENSRRKHHAGWTCIMLMAAIASCSGPTDSRDRNQSPYIISLVAFPDSIGPADSAIVVCHAVDPDGDALVYDWITDARLRPKNPAVPGDNDVYNSSHNHQVFYHGNLPTPYDSAIVQCIARDAHGGGAGALVAIRLLSSNAQTGAIQAKSGDDQRHP